MTPTPRAGPTTGKNAEVWTAVSALAILFAIALPVVGKDITHRMNKLRDHGVVTAAVITQKHLQERRETKARAGGGRAVSRNTVVQTLDLSFDRLASSSFRDVLAGQAVHVSRKPVRHPYTITVGPDAFARLVQGGTVLVTFLPMADRFDKDSFQLFETVKAQSTTNYALWFYAAAVALLLFGIWSGWIAWKRGKASA